MNIEWCKNCVLPNTRPNLFLDKFGICNACNIKLEKKNEKYFKPLGKKKFEKTVRNILKNNPKNNYDCLIPVSGGKDSTWQVIKCLEVGLTPLTVTWKCPSRTKFGQYNLDNLVSLGVDHFDVTINPKIEKKLIYKTFNEKGAAGIPMHLAIFNLSNRIARNFRIPLIIWGENSAKEYGYKKKNHLFKKSLDKEWVKNYGVTNSTLAEDWIDKEINLKNIILYSDKQNLNYKSYSIFLADYFKWDPVISYKAAKKRGFKNLKSAKTGLYDFADIDDNFISIHHYLKWYKFGFSRLFDNLSIEIRSKRITREKAIKIIKKKGLNVPKQDIKIFCKYLGISQKKFEQICEKFRNKKIWKFDAKKKKWFVPNFLISDFNW
jgi:N-acetyl sugar amidotransferase